MRTSVNLREALVVVHGFASAPAIVTIPLPPGNWRIAEEFTETHPVASQIKDHSLHLSFPGDFSARIVHLKQ
jgi:hypothetical protein